MWNNSKKRRSKEIVAVSRESSSPSTGDIIVKNIENFHYIQRRLYWLTSVIGDTTRPFNKYKGVFGGTVWVLNIMIHFSLDFYEAKFLFHASWATSIGVFFLCFVSCTIYTIKNSVPWYIKALRKLSRNEVHEDTVKKLRFVFKFLPFLVPCLAASGAGAQFGCYAYDGALRINFHTESNSTSVPAAVEVLVNIIRMTSLLHIFYAFWFYLIFHLVVLFTIQAAMKEFNGKMRNALKEHPPSISFSQAVDLFSSKTKLLDQGSKSTTVVLTIILVTTSVSFVINAYNFLFVKRLAIYVWFALAPLVWTVSPLMAAAWITWTYRNYKYVVIQAWVEIPEEYDEIWDRQRDTVKHPSSKENLEIVDQVDGNLDSKVNGSQSEGLRRRARTIPLQRELIEENETSVTLLSTLSQDLSKARIDTETNSHEIKATGLDPQSPLQKIDCTIAQDEANNNDLPKVSGNSRWKAIASTALVKSNSTNSSGERKIEALDLSGLINELDAEVSPLPDESDKQILSARTTKKELEEAENNSSSAHSMTIKNTFIESNPRKDLKSGDFDPTFHRRLSALSLEASLRTTGKDLSMSKALDLRTVVGVRQRLENLKNKVTRKRKFNYEKYIKYLDCILITVGFSVGGVIVTWDRASFFCIVLFTLVGVFAQEAFLK